MAHATVWSHYTPEVKRGALGLPKLSRAFETDEALAAACLTRVRALVYTAALGGPLHLIERYCCRFR